MSSLLLCCWMTGLLSPESSLDKTLLAFALLHFLLQGQICQLLQVSLEFLLLHSSPSRLYIVTCLFNLYAECIMGNAGLEEAQSEIKISGRNTNDLRCADDTTLTAESEEELKSLLMKVKEESAKAG